MTEINEDSGILELRFPDEEAFSQLLTFQEVNDAFSAAVEVAERHMDIDGFVPFDVLRSSVYVLLAASREIKLRKWQTYDGVSEILTVFASGSP
jgi:hypothetical protein